MKAEEKYRIKDKIRRTKLATLRETGKRPTKGEIIDVMLDIAKTVKPQENWQEKPRIQTIGDILGKDRF